MGNVFSIDNVLSDNDDNDDKQQLRQRQQQQQLEMLARDGRRRRCQTDDDFGRLVELRSLTEVCVILGRRKGPFAVYRLSICCSSPEILALKAAIKLRSSRI